MYSLFFRVFKRKNRENMGPIFNLLMLLWIHLLYYRNLVIPLNSIVFPFHTPLYLCVEKWTINLKIEVVHSYLVIIFNTPCNGFIKMWIYRLQACLLWGLQFEFLSSTTLGWAYIFYINLRLFVCIVVFSAPCYVFCYLYLRFS